MKKNKKIKKFIPVNFPHHYSSLQSHDPSEIIWFAAQKTFLIIINVGSSIA